MTKHEREVFEMKATTRKRACDMKKQTQKSSQWINIKDGLPKEGDKVLIYSVDNAHGYGIGFYSETYQCFFVNQFADDGVTHWMPLPKEPKPERELEVIDELLKNHKQRT